MSTFFVRKGLDANSNVLGQLGALQTRLARSKAEIRRTQEVRYQVFVEEMGAHANPQNKFLRRDKDRFDEFCDHLLVIDTSGKKDKIVGTYRLLNDRSSRLAGGFYSQAEFDIGAMNWTENGMRMLELGRSCILPKYRSKRTMELLWQGLWSYILANKIDVLFGCASFSGTNISEHQKSLIWLAKNAACHDLKCRGVGASSISLSKLAAGANDCEKTQRIAASLPPLLKGYLRAGAKIGPDAVIDDQFGTIDVFVALNVRDINPRYLAHYGTDASRFAA